jgi:hypothetical protein
MKNLSTGTGLALLAGAIVAFPFVNRVSSIDQAVHAAPPIEAAKSVAAAATAQAVPTIVWYGATGGFLYRAWSTGRIEAASISIGYTSECTDNPGYGGYLIYSNGCTPWRVIFDPNQGFNAAADINFDSKVDGDDLGQLLAAWGDAPRHDIPPSDCPLNLINP